MSITVEEGRTILLAAIAREKATGNPTKILEVGDKCIIDIHQDHPDMTIGDISDIIIPIVDEINS
tara:strand:+ start:2010 stop:2204 length:195 start_codon:yes stop_codon:yes gene_type:complete